MPASRLPVTRLTRSISKTAARARRSALAVAAAACVAAGVVALPLASTAVAGTTSPSQETFRASLGTYLQNLQGALTAASLNPQTRAVVAPHLQGNLKALAVARSHLSALNGTQLTAMQAILGENPAWAKQPNALRQSLSPSSFVTAGVAAASSNTPGILSDCSDFSTLGDERGLFYSAWAAAQAAGIANAVASSLPDGAEYFPGLIAAGTIFGVTNGLSIGLQDRLSRKLDCLAAQSNAQLAAAFPKEGGALTPASSQASVDRLTAAAADIDTTLNIIETVINATTAKLTQVINTLGLAQGNANSIQATSQDLQNRSDGLLSSIGKPSDQATYSGSDPSGTANGLANTIDDRADTTLANTEALKKLSIRLEIEQGLADHSKPPIALFTLPASQGGYLETVRHIVTTTIVNEQAAGQSINGDAQATLAAANDAFDAKDYKHAYDLYAAAYSHAVG